MKTLFLYSLACVLVVSQADASEPVISTESGFQISSSDGAFSFKLGGRIMWDADSFDGVLNRSNDGSRRLSTDLRRSRLELGGTAYDAWKFKFDIDIKDKLGGSNAHLHTVGVGYTGLKTFDVFIGRTKEPFGLEELTSSKSISSIERNYFTEATDTDSQPEFGIRLDSKGSGLGWSIGLFNPAGNPKKSDGGDRIALTGRWFGALIDTDSTTLHLGIAVTDRNIDQPIQQKGFALDIAESGGKLDSSSLTIDSDRQWGVEGLYISGPFSLQSEIFVKKVGGANGGPSGDVHHYYSQATYSLTGERRGYNAKSGIADIIKPSADGWAVELVGKLDHIELDIDGAPTEVVSGYLAGLNLYPNKNVKLMLNVIRVTSEKIATANDDDAATVISTRLQLAF
ncbi:MAG: porin [Pseudomonadota bacterium]|nr:porin [Pseudomonadota bacterium]